jgi:hypothetical protein
MLGYETARVIIDRQREPVQALVTELLDVESVDGDCVKQRLARHAAPALPHAWRPDRRPFLPRPLSARDRRAF